MQSEKTSQQALQAHEDDGLFPVQPALQLQRISGATRNISAAQRGSRLNRAHREETTRLQLNAMLLTLLAGCLLLLTAAVAGAEEIDNGKALHEQACTSCHGTEVYTRPDRKIDSLVALERQVQRCANQAAKVDWNAPQIDAVVNYLNSTFYDFDRAGQAN